MSKTLSLAETVALLEAAATRIVDNVDYLTEVDQAIGDGDHGVGMRRGFAAALDKLKATTPADIEAAFKTVGTAVMSTSGGACGAIFGTWFRAGSAAFKDKATLDAASFAAFLTDGLAAVQKRGGSGPGQKTMIDALAPAADAATRASGEGLPTALNAAAAAAAAGVEATKNMQATTGKARTLGERSLGHPDPGAVSTQLILEAMRDCVVS